MSEETKKGIARGFGLDKTLTEEIPDDLGYLPGSVVLDPRTGEIKPNPLYKTPEVSAVEIAEPLEDTEKSQTADETAIEVIGKDIVDFLNNLDSYFQEFSEAMTANNIQKTMRASQLARLAKKVLEADEITLSEGAKDRLLEIRDIYVRSLAEASTNSDKVREDRDQQWLNSQHRD